MLPVLLRGAEQTTALHAQGLCFVIVAAPGVGELVRQIASQVLGPGHHAEHKRPAATYAGGVRCVVVGAGARDSAFACASLALAACGTVNVELAAAGVPQIAVFKTSQMTEWVIRKWLRPTVRHAALPNIVAGRQLIPELLFEQCTPDRIAEEACFALANPSMVAAEAEQLRRLVLPSMQARDALRRPVPASQAAARALLPYLPAPNG
jgi:lipid-A-disaccharide synthase